MTDEFAFVRFDSTEHAATTKCSVETSSVTVRPNLCKESDPRLKLHCEKLVRRRHSPIRSEMLMAAGMPVARWSRSHRLLCMVRAFGSSLRDLGLFLSSSPALKRWAKVGRPTGRYGAVRGDLTLYKPQAS
jgi:hypothetical protein